MSDIKGYRELNPNEIQAINTIKSEEEFLASLWRTISSAVDVDMRYMAIARTHFEEGFSALVRAVARPESPWESK